MPRAWTHLDGKLLFLKLMLGKMLGEGRVWPSGKIRLVYSQDTLTVMATNHGSRLTVRIRGCRGVGAFDVVVPAWAVVNVAEMMRTEEQVVLSVENERLFVGKFSIPVESGVWPDPPTVAGPEWELPASEWVEALNTTAIAHSEDPEKPHFQGTWMDWSDQTAWATNERMLMEVGLTGLKHTGPELLVPSFLNPESCQLVTQVGFKGKVKVRSDRERTVVQGQSSPLVETDVVLVNRSGLPDFKVARTWKEGGGLILSRQEINVLVQRARAVDWKLETKLSGVTFTCRAESPAGVRFEDVITLDKPEGEHEGMYDLRYVKTMVQRLPGSEWELVYVPREGCTVLKMISGKTRAYVMPLVREGRGLEARGMP